MSFSQDAFVFIPVSTALYAALLRRFPGGAASVVEEVVAQFLDRADEDVPVERAPQGMNYDGLFLPSGSQIGYPARNGFKYGGEVVDGAYWYDGEEFASMNQLCLAMRDGTATNAWDVLHVKRPTDKHFIPLKSLRVRPPLKRLKRPVSELATPLASTK